MSMSRVRWGLAACILIAGCAPTGHPGAASPAPDWRDATYTITCDGVVPGGFRATLHDGAARVPGDVGDTSDYTHFDFRFEADATGDLDGAGRPDTVVLLQCSPQPSNGLVEEV